MPDIVPTHRLTETASLRMITAGVAKANELGCKVSLAVVDQSCRLIGFLMMDGARHFSIITTRSGPSCRAYSSTPGSWCTATIALSNAAITSSRWSGRGKAVAMTTTLMSGVVLPRGVVAQRADGGAEIGFDPVRLL